MPFYHSVKFRLSKYEGPKKNRYGRKKSDKNYVFKIISILKQHQIFNHLQHIVNLITKLKSKKTRFFILSQIFTNNKFFTTLWEGAYYNYCCERYFEGCLRKNVPLLNIQSRADPPWSTFICHKTKRSIYSHETLFLPFVQNELIWLMKVLRVCTPLYCQIYVFDITSSMVKYYFIRIPLLFVLWVSINFFFLIWCAQIFLVRHYFQKQNMFWWILFANFRMNSTIT